MLFESFNVSLDPVESSANSTYCLIAVRIFYVSFTGDYLTLPVS